MKASLIYRLLRILSLGFFRLFFRHKVYGEKNLRLKKAIIASNHVSFLDPSVISISAKIPLNFFARKDLFDVPIIGSIIPSLNTHPIDRSGTNISTMKYICKLINENKIVVIFPEGTRSYSGELNKLKPGIVSIVQKTGCAIVPAYVHGTYEIWSRKRKFPKLFGSRTACIFGKPIFCDEFSGLSKKELKEAVISRLSGAMENLKSWYLEGAKGDPP